MTHNAESTPPPAGGDGDGGDGGADGRHGNAKRTAILAVVAVAALLFTVATDDGDLVRIAKCFGTGDGFGQTKIDGRAFQRDYFGHSYRGTVDNLIDIQVFFHGAYEAPILYAMRDALQAKRPGDDGVALDVGANVGTHSLFLANHVDTVHAIEPWPTVLKRLTEMVEENSIDSIVLHPVGFADEVGTLPFHVPPGFNLGWGSFSDTYADGHYDSDVIDLPLVVGDAYLTEHGVERIDLIKIDIEGYEKPALKGLASTLQRDEPAVFFELNVTNDEGFRSEEELRGAFPEGYRFFEIGMEPEFAWRLPGNWMVVCGHAAGRYELVPFDMRFDVDGRNLIAVDEETAVRLPDPES